MDREFFNDEHEALRAKVRKFIEDMVLPNHDKWTAAGIIEAAFLERAGELGLLGLNVDKSDGGAGHSDYRFNQVVLEEFEYAGVGACGTGLMYQNDIVAPYLSMFATNEQKEAWLRGLCSGSLVGCLAITEAGAGSDIAAVATTAEADADGYVVNGRKTLIGCGMKADFAIAVVRTDPNERHRGLSLLVLEHDMEGFERVQNMDRPGRKPQDIAELAFHDVWVPRANLLGEEGWAFKYLMQNLARERMNVAVSAVAACRYMYELTLSFVKGRVAFGQPIGSFQANKFTMAEMATELTVAEAFIDRCVDRLSAGSLSGSDAAMAKWWCTELQVAFSNRCVQLHGARGWMGESDISRAWIDARITTIFAGTTEIMKEIVGRSIGL